VCEKSMGFTLANKKHQIVILVAGFTKGGELISPCFKLFPNVGHDSIFLFVIHGNQWAII